MKKYETIIYYNENNFGQVIATIYGSCYYFNIEGSKKKKNKKTKQNKNKNPNTSFTLHSSSSSSTFLLPFHHITSFSLSQKKTLTSSSKPFSPAAKSMPFNMV